MDIASWLKLFDSVGFPVATLIACTFGLAIAFTRYLWPFFITQAWPTYLERTTAHHTNLLADRERLVITLNTQRTEAIATTDRLRESFNMQLDSRGQELMKMVVGVSEVTRSLDLMRVSIENNTKTTEKLLLLVESLVNWNGNERRNQ